MRNKSSEWLDYIELGFDSISLKCLKNTKTVYQDENSIVLDDNSVEWKPCINRESKSLELTIKLYSCHDINMKLLVVVTQPSIDHTPHMWVTWVYISHQQKTPKETSKAPLLKKDGT